MDDIAEVDGAEALEALNPEPLEAPDPSLGVFDLSAPAEDDDPPFDPPDEDDEIFGKRAPSPPLEADETRHSDSGPPPRGEVPTFSREPDRRAVERPAPAISIHVSWDRPEFGGFVNGLANDRRLARTTITSARGGIEGAAERYSVEPSPDLIVLDTTLSFAAMLAALDRLSAVTEPTTKIIIAGAVNDVGLLRELARRGVSQYLLAPTGRDEVIRAVCELYADVDKSRVIAVVGARGGVGASTLANNLAWSIAERQETSATLVDLDLSFGTAAFSREQNPERSIADGLLAPEEVDDAFLDKAAIKQTPRLHVLAAPATLDAATELDAQSVKALIQQVRRTSSCVILDLPHRWSSWVRELLFAADEIVLVAAPDLASMRNTRNILSLLAAARSRERQPQLVLSMTGAPKRPEISSKDFAEAVGISPAFTLAFDPALYGLSEIRGQSIGETAPLSEAALTLDALATSLTGREPVKRQRTETRQVQPVPAKAAPRASSEDHIWPPFTFGPPPAEPSCASSQPPPLVLVEKAAGPSNDDLLRSARRAALASADALSPTSTANPRAATRERRRGRPGTVRLVTLAALVLIGLWYVQSRREAAAASRASIAASPAAERQADVPEAPAPDPDAQFDSALSLISSGDVQAGLDLLHDAAEAGSALAQYRLAKLYETGDGVTADLAVARRWTERAAEAGNTHAMHDLGVYLAQGEGGPQDESAAFRWFRQAAELGLAASQYNLGLLYEQGRGVDADGPEALFWFLLAARQGEQHAAAHVAAVEAQLSPPEIEEAHARVQAFHPRTAHAPG